MSKPTNKISFVASIPQTLSALKFGNDVARVTFEVPSSDVEEVVGLIALQGLPLKITVEVEE